MRVTIKQRRSPLLWLEYLFLLVGLAGIDYYVWVQVDSNVSQMYADWKFERSLHGENSSVPEFMVDEHGFRRIFGFGSAPSGSMPAPPAQNEGGAQAFAPQLKPYDVIGRIEIPRLKVRVMIREGDDEATLRDAVGHIPSTALPGQIGNVALAAHRDTYFRPLRNIRKNDRIVVSTLHGAYEYLVQTTQIVSPSDVSVLKASAPHELTLVTCYPFYYIGSAPRRFVVHATQIAATPQPPPQQIGS